VGYLYYLLKGEVEAHLRDGTVTPRAEGSVIGEVSFRTGGTATASVIALSPCLTMRWPQPVLKALCSRNAAISRAVNDLVSSQLAHKLSSQVAPSPVTGDE
jgi:CRP-like cAMP-binding protein